MGLGPSGLSLYEELARARILKPGRMIELGSQDLVPEQYDLTRLFDAFGRPWTCPLDGSARSLMEALGFEYECIDRDERHGAINVDLNYIGNYYKLPRSWRDFDVVTNLGTSEHIFDQGSCFLYMHALCRAGGLMIHVVPHRGLSGRGPEEGYGGHGFYLYATGFFADLAHANGYEVLRDYTWTDNAGDLTVAVLRPGPRRPFNAPIQSMYRGQ